jgi:hypothetical protein
MHIIMYIISIIIMKKSSSVRDNNNSSHQAKNRRLLNYSKLSSGTHGMYYLVIFDGFSFSLTIAIRIVSLSY